MYAELSGEVDQRRELRIERATDATLTAYMDVFMAGFEMPEFLRQPMGELFIQALDPELFVHLLAWDDDAPVGCGTVFLHDGTAGIYNIAVPERTAAAGSGTPSPPR